MQLGCSAFFCTPFLSNFLLPSKGTKTTLETVEHVNGFPKSCKMPGQLATGDLLPEAFVARYG